MDLDLGKVLAAAILFGAAALVNWALWRYAARGARAPKFPPPPSAFHVKSPGGMPAGSRRDNG